MEKESLESSSRSVVVISGRCSHALLVLFGKLKTATPSPIFAVLLSSSTGAKRKASNRYGG
ncbi:hypothetical protein EYF80_059919 [Liparis tanakae]|uniref:Uncharacterized protein n=1 Tax=Liparis tanakae TaxID=230148 RepID=A0A4Z2EMX9_9TELE|nr:hypothetical protein EYF80_059919 [Liparis tanakae]